MANTKVLLTGFGGPERLQLVTEPDLPQPGPSEVRVQVLAASASFTDVMIRKGLYPEVKARPPFALGYDMVGRVDAAGPGAGRFAPGQMVADLTVIGAQAEYLCLPEDRLTAVPDGLDPAQAVACVLSFVTPWQMLHRVARARAGQSLLIHGAGGAVGTAMLQLARLAGLRAVGTDRPEKHQLIEDLGGVAVDRAPDGLAARLRAEAGEGFDMVFDPIGGASFRRSLDLLRPGGILVAFGFLDATLGRGGGVAWDFLRIKLWNLLPNRRATAFYSIGAMRKRHPDWFRDDLAAIFGLLAEDKIRPVIADILPLAQARAAHDRIEAGGVAGKIVLVTPAYGAA
ncbi:MAG: medium chain dehydrogenase/reductase family protein [Rhodobacter sp.]|nr:medium chain dehydrogenase/reductase family protein [Rhodobacter sp.]